MAKVLIVDDSALVTSILSHLLAEEPGFQPVSAASYAQAQQILQTDADFIAAVVDMHLPDADNGEAIDLVLGYNIPTIVLSASYTEEIRQQFFGRGVIDYLVKEGSHSWDYAIRIIRRLDRNRHCCTLVVDDSATTRSMISSLLKLCNLPVAEAADGVEALAIMQQYPDIQLVITDYHMPNMDGFELVRALRRSHSYEALSIIGLSGDDSGAVSARFIRSGANDFLRKPFSFEELQVRIMQNLETIEYVQAIRRTANQDYLTGLNNRRCFFETGEALLRAATGQQQASAVAIMDLDHFKQVNDSWGHDIGDAVLVHMAGLMKQLPENLLSARLGGEEFGLLFAGESLERAEEQLQQFCRLVAATPVLFEHDGEQKSLSVTLSIGVTDQGSGLDEMLKIADQGLYAAKEGGRNRVVVTGA